MGVLEFTLNRAQCSQPLVDAGSALVLNSQGVKYHLQPT